MPEKPPYWKDPDKIQDQRAPWHDYRSRQIYMITISKATSSPPFGFLKLADIPEYAHIEISPLGEIIREEILATPRHNSEIRILNYVIMPDHFHVLLFVTCAMKKHLGAVIQGIKSSITARCRLLLGDSGLQVMGKGFSDRIIMRKGQTDAASKYIDDNPYRLAVRKTHPEFFRRVNTIEVCGIQLQAYGNLHLLGNPFKMQVVVHRADTHEALAAKKARWLHAAANGGVLVSPFISAAEKQVREESESFNGRNILITIEPFAERYKPWGRNFELCAQGRLLIISAAQAFSAWRRCEQAEYGESKGLTREMCIYLNWIASKVAEY